MKAAVESGWSLGLVAGPRFRLLAFEGRIRRIRNAAWERQELVHTFDALTHTFKTATTAVRRPDGSFSNPQFNPDANSFAGMESLPHVGESAERPSYCTFEEKIVSIKMASEHPAGRVNELTKDAITYRFNLPITSEAVVELERLTKGGSTTNYYRSDSRTPIT